MEFHLKDTAHAAWIGDDLVFLDVADDAYFCLPEARRRLELDAQRAKGSSNDESLLADLRAMGLIVPVVAARAERPVIPPLPTSALRPGAEGGWSPRELRNLLGALFDYFVHYRWRAFAHILALAATNASASPLHADEALRLAERFAVVVVWLPISGQCLARSFVLLRFLQRCGGSATWVFGVQTWPFSAHCWLQLDGVALDDVPERLLHYEPILAV